MVARKAPARKAPAKKVAPRKRAPRKAAAKAPIVIVQNIESPEPSSLVVDVRQEESRTEQSGLADSGLRHEFVGGAQRELAPSKGRFDLLSPIALRELALHMEAGAAKYADRNWERGLPLHTFVDSAMRHLGAVLEGDMSEPHARAALWNVHGLIHTQIMIERGLLPAELDDLPNYLV